jgi:NADH-quinone oxidoreductase subunit C
MIDADVRLGLSGSDLMIRNRTHASDLAKLQRQDLTVENCNEIKVLTAAGLVGEIRGSKRSGGQDFLVVGKERVVEILTVLRDHKDTHYNLLSDLLGLDLLGFNEGGAEGPRFEVIYSLYSLTHFKRFVVKAQVSEDDATIDTTSEVYPAANWAEREVFDMFGFNHHPDLRRILMPDDWIGHPLRKDFPLGGEEVEFSHNVRDQGAQGGLKK